MNELATHIERSQENSVLRADVILGELVVEAVISGLLPLVEFLKTDPRCLFRTLIDITAVDYPGRDRRFEVVYHLLSMNNNQRVRVKMAVFEDETVHSITGLYPSADWYERETFDMYGILFAGHSDLRRILTDYGFYGHPLRKDFPTTGYSEVRYDEVQKKVVYEPVQLVQEYRQFDFMSPWEGSERIMEAMNKESEE